MVYELLKSGKENASTTKELITMLALESSRELQQLIQSERNNGKVILSTTGDGGGYYLPGNEMELREFIQSMENRSQEIEKSTKSARQELQRMTGADNERRRSHEC